VRTPPNVVAYRCVIAVVTVLVLVSLGFGLAGQGPLASLHRLASPVTDGLYLNKI
jgi:hypothetical protein